MIDNADLLDVVRKLRTYLATLDSCHMIATTAKNIDDPTIGALVNKLLPDCISANQKVMQLLRAIESSKQYREMLKMYNLSKDI